MKPRRLSRYLATAAAALLAAVAVVVPALPASAFVPGIAALSGSATSTTITLSWQLPASPHGNAYVGAIIRRSSGDIPPASATAGTAVTTTINSARSYIDKHLHPNQSYAYAVFATFHNGDLSGAATKVISTLPDSVSGLHVDGSTPTTVTLAWKNPTEAGFRHAYLVRTTGTKAPTTPSSGSGANDQVVIGTTSASTDQYTDIGLTPGTKYSYAVFAEYAHSKSAPKTVSTSARSITWYGAGTGTNVPLGDVSCVSTTFCAGPGGGFAAQQFNGTSWTTPYQWDDPSGEMGELAEISCSSRYYCLAVNDYGDAAFYSGDAWQSSQHVDSTSSLGFQSVSCVKNLEFCFAIDGNGFGYEYVDGQLTGKWQIDASANETLGSVSCATRHFCVVTAGSSHRYTFNGYEWTRSSLGAGAGAGLLGGGPTSCVSASFCMEVATSGESQIYNGHSWIEVKRLPIIAGDPVDSVSCVSSTFCMAVTQDGEEAVYSGIAPEGHTSPRNIGEWDWSKKPTSEAEVDAVSCGSTKLCVVVGETVPTYDGFALYARS
jgi:hypothetical protein